MTCSFEFYPTGAQITYRGNIKGDDIVEAKRQFFAHQFKTEARYVLCDFSAVEKLDVFGRDVDRIVSQDRRAVATHPNLLEIVVAPQPYQFGMGRMWEQQISEDRAGAHVVQSRKEALAWLEERGVKLGE